MRLEKYLSQLNEAQLAPTLQKEGPLLVIAGAGSGKTRVLTFRIAYLMSQGVDAFNILALTFTNKAAKEMKGRIAEIVGSGEAKTYGWERFTQSLPKFYVLKAITLGFQVISQFTTLKILKNY